VCALAGYSLMGGKQDEKKLTVGCCCGVCLRGGGMFESLDGCILHFLELSRF